MALSVCQKKFLSRRESRRIAVQGLYAWSISSLTLAEIEQALIDHEQLCDVDTAPYFRFLMQGTLKHVLALDEGLRPVLSRALAQVDPIALSILRIALFELWHVPDVPPKVVINEAIELAKRFGPTDSFKFINGAVHQLTTLHRSGAS